MTIEVRQPADERELRSAMEIAFTEWDPSRTDAAPQLELDVADLAAVYLGAFDFAYLARAAPEVF